MARSDPMKVTDTVKAVPNVGFVVEEHQPEYSLLVPVRLNANFAVQLV